LELTPLERAVDAPLGHDPKAPALPPPEPGLAPLAALERALLPALERTPCLVSFSGGRDSSAVLAAAVRAARRAGLPTPIPLTVRVTGRPEADESDWQELVIGHLGLDDWMIQTVSDELDLLGPRARAALRQHGLLYPSQAFSQLLLLEAAAGGSLVTGWDGDGLFGDWQYARAAAILRGRLRPERRDVLRLLKALAPTVLRREWLRRRAPSFPWLRAKAQAQLDAAWAAELASEPARWDRRVAWHASRRAVRGVMETAGRLAAASRTRVFHPMLDPLFLSSLAQAGKRTGVGDRTEAMRAIFTELLPDDLLRRESKADFTLTYWGPHAREFARGWNGEGVPDDLIDLAGLRSAWLAPVPHHASAALLQQAWLASSGGGQRDQPLDGGRHG
jgi:asparagine synthase (glutamine-hydrolysing)